MKHSLAFRMLCVSFVLFAVASCSLLGASTDPLINGGEGGDCPTGSQLCSSTCVDTTSNATSCGTCGNACPSGQACVGSKCQVACPGGQVVCSDSLCYATSNDPRHCGDCNTTCKAGEVCGDAHCTSTCPDGQTNCGGSCADLQTDAKHCGTCGVTCDANDECVEGKCLIACKTQLNQPITDPWGWSWDGLERAASTFDAAQKTCTAFRGRLPTASELYRVSATQSATVGQTINTNPLWSLAPAGPGVHARMRLSTGAYAADLLASDDTAPTNYRCTCPPVLPKVYVGANCFGQPNTNACITLNDATKRENIDAKDRPALPKGAAVWECGFYNAHLPSSTTMVEAIQQGGGNGTANWLHVGNEVRYDLGALVQFTGDGKGFLLQYEGAVPGPANSAAWDAPTTPHFFRCVGDNYAPTPLPAIKGEWAGSPRRKMEGTDLTAATQIEAVDACFKKGGHLPSTAELNEFVVQGLPGGTDTFVWTSDQTGYDASPSPEQPSGNFTVSVIKWKDVATTHLYGGADMTWSYKTDSRSYRCVYYPIDAAYTGPAATSCTGGCTAIPLPGAIGGKMWLENKERPAATLTAAIDQCRQLGGHMPSQRDMTEAIRAGLPNGLVADAAGNHTFLWTSDIEIGNCGNTPNACGNCATNPEQCGGQGVNLLAGVVEWTGTMPTYDDLWDAAATSRSTWGFSFDARPYRCMWTNELR